MPMRHIDYPLVVDIGTTNVACREMRQRGAEY